MNLYTIEQDKNNGYDAFDSAEERMFGIPVCGARTRRMWL